jgi:hypothetical protein
MFNLQVPTPQRPDNMRLLISFHKHYLRNNRGSGRKNIRCFPRCCEDGHVTRGFCGSAVYIAVRNLTPWDMFFIQIVPQSGDIVREEPHVIDLKIGRTYTRSYLEGHGNPNYAIGEVKKLFKGHLPQTPVPKDLSVEKDETIVQFNPSAWSCGWTSNKHSHATQHIVRAYRFKGHVRNNPDGSTDLAFECTQCTDSPPFQMSSTKRFQVLQAQMILSGSKGAEGTAIAETCHNFSDPELAMRTAGKIFRSTAHCTTKTKKRKLALAEPAFERVTKGKTVKGQAKTTKAKPRKGANSSKKNKRSGPLLHLAAVASATLSEKKGGRQIRLVGKGRKKLNPLYSRARFDGFKFVSPKGVISTVGAIGKQNLYDVSFRPYTPYYDENLFSKQHNKNHPVIGRKIGWCALCFQLMDGTCDCLNYSSEHCVNRLKDGSFGLTFVQRTRAMGTTLEGFEIGTTYMDKTTRVKLPVPALVMQVNGVNTHYKNRNIREVIDLITSTPIGQSCRLRLINVKKKVMKRR